MQASSAAMEEHRRDIRSLEGDGEELLRAPSGPIRRPSESGSQPAQSYSPPSRHLIQLSALFEGQPGPRWIVLPPNCSPRTPLR